jgi:hypothetical protein
LEWVKQHVKSVLEATVSRIALLVAKRTFLLRESAFVIDTECDIISFEASDTSPHRTVEYFNEMFTFPKHATGDQNKAGWWSHSSPFSLIQTAGVRLITCLASLFYVQSVFILPVSNESLLALKTCCLTLRMSWPKVIQVYSFHTEHHLQFVAHVYSLLLHVPATGYGKLQGSTNFIGTYLQYKLHTAMKFVAP